MAHHRFRLYDDPDEGPQPQRPELTVWFDPSNADCDGQAVTIGVGAAWGTQQRFIAMTQHEAKDFAKLLIKVANEATSHELRQAADPS